MTGVPQSRWTLSATPTSQEKPLGRLLDIPGCLQVNSRFGNSFVTKLNTTGAAVLYSTRLGGARDAELQGYSMGLVTDIAVDAAGNAYVTGFTASTDFPTTPGAFSDHLQRLLSLGLLMPL